MDTAGHYSRPDILRLKIDRCKQNIVEDMERKFDETVYEHFQDGQQGLDGKE